MRIISPAEAIPIWLPFWFLYHRNWSTPDFTEGLEYLRRNPALFDRRHLLSDHNGKQVWHIQLPPEYGGRNVVYKSCSTRIGALLGSSFPRRRANTAITSCCTGSESPRPASSPSGKAAAFST